VIVTTFGSDHDAKDFALRCGPTTALVVVSSRFISMSSSFATIAGSYQWPRFRPCSASELGANQRITRRYAALRTFPSLTPIPWGLLKQPDKQEATSVESSLG
jgi:hypothetical protein